MNGLVCIEAGLFIEAECGGDSGRGIDKGDIPEPAGEASAIGTSSSPFPASPDTPMVPVVGDTTPSLLAANTFSIVTAEGLFGRGSLLGDSITAVPDLNSKAIDCPVWGWVIMSAALNVVPTGDLDFSRISSVVIEAGDSVTRSKKS